MILVTGTYRLPVEVLEAALEPMRRVVSASRAEPGCLGYAYAQDVTDPGLFHVVENWVDRAALDAHFAQPHMKRWQEERAALGLTERKVVAHMVSASEPL